MCVCGERERKRERERERERERWVPHSTLTQANSFPQLYTVGSLLVKFVISFQMRRFPLLCSKGLLQSVHSYGPLEAHSTRPAPYQPSCHVSQPPARRTPVIRHLYPTSVTSLQPRYPRLPHNCNINQRRNTGWRCHM